MRKEKMREKRRRGRKNKHIALMSKKKNNKRKSFLIKVTFSNIVRFIKRTCMKCG